MIMLKRKGLIALNSIISLLLLIFTDMCLHAQVIDRAPSGKQNNLPVEGGGIRMEPDVTTPLDDLIKRLEGDWELIETGKGYWIGYTADMFSIAARGDEAIPKLMSFFKSVKADNGKIGAIYTLHLIGINRTIAGRFYEEFVNQKARAALLQLLPEKGYSYFIMELLMRDPWRTDIPHLLALLANTNEEDLTWPIINCLDRYQIDDLPVGNEIPNTIANLTIRYKEIIDPSGKRSAIKDVLTKFANEYPLSIDIEESLYAAHLKYPEIGLNTSFSVNDLLRRLRIARNNVFNYCTIGNNIQYYFKDGVLHFITIATARQMVNKWWAGLPAEAKARFN